MIIYCNTAEEFYDAIAALVQRGLTFESRTSDFRITLTGGY